MFIRIKKINGQKYGYLVENDWTKKGSRQKVKKYLGKIIELDTPAKEKSIILKKNSPEKTKEQKFETVIFSLAEHQLQKQGFVKNKKYKGTTVYSLNDILVTINPETKKFFVTKKNKEVVLAMNEGFLCPDTINELLNFNGYGREEQVGLRLANALVETGLQVTQDTFVELFNKKFKRLE